MTGAAVVLGAGGTLGSAIAARLSRRGLAIVGVGRRARPPDALCAAVPGLVWCSADLTAADSGAVVAGAVPGSVVAIVQATGLSGGGTLETIDAAAMGRAIDSKLGGWLRVLRALDDRFVEGTRLIALGGHYGAEPSPHAPLAGVTNAALANLVRQIAIAYGPRGITVHLVAPGPVESDRMDGIARAAAEREGIDPEVVLDRYRAASPLGRLTTADEVAWAVDRLLDPEAAALHGSTLWLDAGRRHGIL